MLVDNNSSNDDGARAAAARADHVRILLQTYPAAKHAVDRRGRTPLHWYLGAGDGEEVAVAGQEDGRDDQALSSDADPRIMDPEIVELLLSSRVARTLDARGRAPLHWACSLWAAQTCLRQRQQWQSRRPPLGLDVVQLILNSFVGQLTVQDAQLRTPVMVLFETAHQIQRKQWNKEMAAFAVDGPNNNRKKKKDSWNLTTGGPAAFAPPLELMQMLLRHPDGDSDMDDDNSKHAMAAMEDVEGRLPIHAALEVAASAEIVQLLIDLHPTALVHTTESLRVPLHAAFCHEWTAPLQSKAVVDLLFCSYSVTRQGIAVDGRLAMKMEDAIGYYPIHYACHNGAPLEVIQSLVERYPQTALLTKPNGDLPVHCLLDDHDLLLAAVATTKTTSNRFRNDETNGGRVEVDEKGRVLLLSQVSAADESIMQEQLLVAREKIRALVLPLLSDPNKLAVSDSARGMMPLHCAILFESTDYALLLRLLELCPASAVHFTGKLVEEDDSTTYSPLDLLEITKARNTHLFSGERLEEWQHMRELLYSFSPRLESHRHRQELLDRCVRVILDEVNGGGNSFHWKAQQKRNGNVPDLEITHTVSNMEASLRQQQQTLGGRSRRRSTTRYSKHLAANKSRHQSARRSSRGSFRHNHATEPSTFSAVTQQPSLKSGSSIYDEENTDFEYDFNAASGAGRSDDDDDEDEISVGSYASGDEDDDYSGDGTDSASGTDNRGSRALYTTSASRLKTTFEEGTIDSHDDGDNNSSFNLISPPEETTCDYFNDSGSRPPSMDLSNTTSRSFGSILDRVVEEKKDDAGDAAKPKASQRDTIRTTSKTLQYQRPSYMSEVAMRLWTFFVLYCDPNNPGDHYVKQVADIIEDMKFSTIQQLVSNPVPPYASEYLREGESIEGRCFRDVASPKCRELILKTCYFLGRYELQTDQDILVHRSDDCTSVVVKVDEWLFTTEEATDAINPGISEENIWATGVVPAEVGITFRAHKRPVWILLTKSATQYENEVKCRVNLGIAVDEYSQSQRPCGIVPLLQHYNALAKERKIDQMYSVDIKDKRFNSVNLLQGTTAGEEKIHLDEYPYAIVYPAPLHGTLYDYFLRHGVRSVGQTREIVFQVANALKFLHENGEFDVPRWSATRWPLKMQFLTRFYLQSL